MLARFAEQQARDDDSDLDLTDIPEIENGAVLEFRRPSKRLVAVRLDPDIFAWIRSFGPGYSTRINNVLRAVMEGQKAKQR